MKKKWSHLLLTVGTIGILNIPMLLSNKAEEKKDDKQPKKIENIVIKKDSVKNSVRTISYWTDTLSQGKRTLMYYLNNKIIRNYVDNNNSFRMQLPYFVHEDWHKHNAGSEFRYKYTYSPEEYFKLCMHDEITANIAAILTARFEYLSSPDKEAIIAKYENTYMGFYFKAIKAGIVNPESTDPTENEAEWKFLANGTKDMWMTTFAKQYSPTTLSMLKNYIDRKGICESNPQNYKMIKNYMYTIGGVNFAKYLEEDIEYKSDEVSIAESLSQVHSIHGEKKKFVEDVLANMPKLKHLSPNLRIPAIQHVIIASMLKASINEKEDPITIQNKLSVQYNKIMYNLTSDLTLYRFVSDQAINELIKHPEVEDKAEYKDIINQIYTYKGVNLSEYIKNYSISNVPFAYVHTGSSYLYENATEIDIALSFRFCNIQPRTDGIRFQKNEPVANTNKEKPRRSSEQQIEIPNLRDPLLTAMTSEQRDTLYQMLQSFENIPAVLKGCNTKEIEKYKKQNESSELGLKINKIKEVSR